MKILVTVSEGPVDVLEATLERFEQEVKNLKRYVPLQVRTETLLDTSTPCAILEARYKERRGKPRYGKH